MTLPGMLRAAAIALCAVALQGCAAAAVTFAGANVVSLMHSDKTAVDHTVSLVAEQDCSVLHTAERAAYCQPIPAHGPADEVAALAGRLYCYRTLGGVHCYDRPDYGASAETRVNYAHGVAPATGPDAAPASALAARPRERTVIAQASPVTGPSVAERSLGPAAAPLPPLPTAPGMGTY